MFDTIIGPHRKGYKVTLKRLFGLFSGKVHAEINYKQYITARIAAMSNPLHVLTLILLVSLLAPMTFTVASPGVHINVPHSPLSPGQPVYIEYHTDFGEDGTIQMDITKPPLLAIFWQSGPMPISGGLLYDITAPGFTDPGTYVVSASVSISGGGTIHGSTTFEVLGGGQPGGGQPGFDFHLEVSPPMREVERGETAHFQIHVVYSDPSFSGTMVNVHVAGLGPGMQWHMEPGGQLRITTAPETPPGSYPIEIIGEAQGIVRQTTATLVVREGPPEPPPEEPPPEEPPPEEPPPEEPPEEHPAEPPEEPPEEHPPEEHPPEEYYPQEPERWGEEEREPASVFFLDPLFLIIIALVVVVLILLILVLRRPASQPPQISTRYCSKCGAPVKPGQTFCGSCGERVEN